MRVSDWLWFWFNDLPGIVTALFLIAVVVWFFFN